MVSYADFITLLFAFFVVMYAISSVNEGKYKTLSDSLGEAFSNKEQQSNQIDPIQIGTLPTTIQPIPQENLATADAEKRRKLSEEILKERKQLAQVSDQLEQVLAPFIDEKLVSVKKNDYWIELEMNSEMLFLSGEAELSKKAIPVLKKIAEVINPLPNMINIEGHTDNVPIDNLKFRSNWDLSSARATSVVHEFVQDGIAPPRLSAIGYGEFHPIGDNKTEEGRFKNRRVVLVLMAQAFARYGANDEERAKLLNLEPTATP
jgi:chemotaxis protein MotB